MSTRTPLFRYLAPAAVAVLAGAVAHFAADKPVLAQANKTVRWSTYAPVFGGGYSGKINAFAYDPSNPSIMFIGGGWGNTQRESPSQAGVYRTTDGKHWTAIDNGLTNADGTISSVVNGLWVDRTNPSIVLAATEFGGTFRSIDGGDTWTNVDRAKATQFSQSGSALYLATRKADPQAPKRLAPAVVLTTRFGAYSSYDTGSHWHRIDETAIPHHFIGVTWRNGYVYLASFGGGVIRAV